MNISAIKSVVAIAVIGAAAQAQATQVLINGNFETGTFAGWTATTTQASPFTASLNDGQNSQVVNGAGNQPAWFLRNKSANYFGGSNVATPISGYSAFNGFDGSGGNFLLSQGFTFGGSATTAKLDFSFAAQASYSSAVRTFDAQILDATGTAILFNAFHFDLPQQVQTWNVQNISLDLANALNVLGAGSYKLAFREFVPGNYTGPAQFAIDNISLDIKVPEPASLGLLGLGLLGLAAVRRRKSA
jgi:hypothetical protein